MSDTLADLASWLPSDFLSDNIENNTPLFPNNTLCYPYDHFGSCSSTESESDDDDVTGLTRSFTRSLSLQMTHHHHGFSGPTTARLTPTTPFDGHADEDSWERLYAAAAQIAEMKMMKINPDGLFRPTRPGGVGPTSYHPNSGLRMREQYLRCAGTFNGVNRPLGFRHSAWGPLPLENKRRQQMANRQFVTNRRSHVVKRECAGTGVFLPRSYVPEPQEYKKPQACSSPGLLPARVVAQSYNKRLVDPTIIPQQPNIHGVFGPQQLNIINAHSAKLLMARRNAAMLAQQQLRNTAYVSDDVVLPQEWTY